MAKLPLGQGLDDDGDDLRPARGQSLTDSRDEAPASDDATVILRETDDEKKDRDKQDEITILDGDRTSRDSDQHDDDERLNADQRGDDRPPRREERRYRKDRQRQAREGKDRHIQRLERELDELRSRVHGQDVSSVRRDVATVDARIADMQRTFGEAERAVADAITASDGEEAAKAMRVRDEAAARLANLQAVRAQAVNSTQNPGAPRIDPDAARLGHQWMRDNPWYDPEGADEDSAIMLTIDAQLTKEGYRANTEEYWEELTERGRRRIPDRFVEDRDVRRTRRDDDDHDDRAPRRTGRDDQRSANGQRRGPPVGGAGGDVPSGDGSRARRVYVDPEFKRTLIEAGIWDDPKRLRRALEHRRQFDERERERRATSR